MAVRQPLVTTPTMRKMIAGSELTALREQAGYTQESAAAALRIKQKRVSEHEGGQLRVSPNDMRAYLDLYGVREPEVRDTMLELCHGTTQHGRWTGYRRAHPDGFRPYVDMEEDADLIRMVALQAPPGLLQDERFIRELHLPPHEQLPPDVVADAEDKISARLARQQVVLRDTDPAHARVVLFESAVRFTHGVSMQAMHDQLMHLVWLMDHRPNVGIHLLPYNARTRKARLVNKSFTLLRIPNTGMSGPREIVYSADPDAHRYQDVPTAVRLHDELFHDLIGEAEGAESTRSTLWDIASEYRKLI